MHGTTLLSRMEFAVGDTAAFWICLRVLTNNLAFVDFKSWMLMSLAPADFLVAGKTGRPYRWGSTTAPAIAGGRRRKFQRGHDRSTCDKYINVLT